MPAALAMGLHRLLVQAASSTRRSRKLVMLSWIAGAILALAGAEKPLSAAEELPLHERIDRAIEAALPQLAPDAAAAKVTPQLSDDAAFVRRVYLDLTGCIPTAAEARAFIEDAATDKRAKLINALLESPAYPRRMRELFNVMLLERRGTSPEWNHYLEASFAANKPWNQLAQEILAGNPGDDAKLAGSDHFYIKRLENYGQNPVDYDALTRDVGRLFFGVDLQCANCHNHLFIDDYQQADYKGLFLLTSSTFNRKDGDRTVLEEKLLEAKLDFSSVFDKVEMKIGPKVPGLDEVEIPSFPKGEEYLVPPDRKTRHPGVPKFSPRKMLAEQAPQSVNFRLNAANRLWWVAMGRGQFDPLDLSHSDNPPSHPELLHLLADELVAHNYDIKWFLRELLLSKTYQRSSQMPENTRVPPESFLVAIEKPLSAEQLTWSVLQATGNLSAIENGEQPQEGAPALPKLTEVFSRFETAFANPPMEPEVEFKPSVKSALFLSNDNLVLNLLKPRPGNLTHRLFAAKDNASVAEELFLSVLSRKPTADEESMVAEYLAQRSDNREQALKNLAWALLASSEFCLNH